MNSGLLVRLRPMGPWRIGPPSGARTRVESVYHSDALYSAITSAMAQLGTLEQWLQATALAPGAPAVRLTSCFPWQGDTLFVVPPRSIWPLAVAGKLRAKGARFIPVPVVASILSEERLEEGYWTVDGHSQCLVPRDGSQHPAGPFRVALRSGGAVDRTTGARILVHRTACLEFAEGAGLWALVGFADEEARDRWAVPVEGALRLLADSGFGGERSLGWGRSAMPEITLAQLPELLLPNLAPAPDPEQPESAENEHSQPRETAYWLLSLFSPSGEDEVDWNRGDYSLITRGGRVESPGRWGEAKKLLRLVEEGSVLFASTPPTGRAADVAPEGFPHPVFRSGFAFCVPIPWRVAS